MVFGDPVILPSSGMGSRPSWTFHHLLGGIRGLTVPRMQDRYFPGRQMIALRHTLCVLWFLNLKTSIVELA
jgi:hypothetical protein